MTEPFGMPTFIRVGKKKTPKNLSAPSTVRPPTEPGQATLGPDYTVVDNADLSTGSYSHTFPSSTTGDLLLLWVYSDNSTVAHSVTGFTQIAQNVETSTGRRASLWYRISDGTEGTTQTISADSTGGASMMWVVRGGGVDYATNPPEGNVVDFGTNDPPSVAPTTAPAEHLVFACLGWQESDLDGPPTNYTFIRSDDPTTGKNFNPRTSVAWQLVDITTSEDPATFVVSNTAGQQPITGTVAVLAESTSPVASGDHTHTESDVTDLDHWTETDHDALDHTGLTGVGGVEDHGALTGLADDDHTLYTKADGTRAFTGTVSGVTPTADAHLSTKAYVDEQAGQDGPGHWEVLLVDVGGTLEPLTTEDGSDWLYGWVPD